MRLMTPGIRPGVAQLAYLHVSRLYRRRGVAARLARELMRCASEPGARRIYVSATPSESAVGFYRSPGFRPTDPMPELLELEPDDVHMIAELPGCQVITLVETKRVTKSWVASGCWGVNS